MYQKSTPVFLIAETPVHAGSGSDLGYIDLPIQRESHTGYPKIESSSLKGALRQAFESGKMEDDDYIEALNRVFGYDELGLNDKIKAKFKDKTDFAGAIGFTDARILLFPVKSLKGTFAWLTCPAVIQKLKHEVEDICKQKSNIQVFDNKVYVTENCSLYIDKSKKESIQLEEYTYEPDKDTTSATELSKWLKDNVFAGAFDYWENKITENLVIVPDDDFADFVKFSTEVNTRIKIDNETGTVKDGALFTIEYLPQETVMYSLTMFSPEFREHGMKVKEVENFFMNKNYKPDFFQLGGNATIGKGIVKLVVNEKGGTK